MKSFVKLPDGTSVHLKSKYEILDKHGIIYTGGKLLFTKDEVYLFSTKLEDIMVVCMETGKVIHILEGDTELVTCFSLSPDETKLVVASRSLQIRIWNWKKKEITYSFKSQDGPVSMMSWENSSTLLAMGTSQGLIKVWDLDKKFITHSFRGSNGIISVLQFLSSSKDLYLISSAVFDKRIRIWSLNDKRLTDNLEGHMSVVRGITFSHCGNFMVSASRDNTVIIWKFSIKNVKPILTIPVMESVESIVFSPLNAIKLKDAISESENQFFITAGSSGALRVWHVPSGENVFSVEFGGQFLEMCLLPSLSRLACVNNNHEITFHSFPSLSVSRRLIGYSDEVLDLRELDQSHLLIATNCEKFNILHLETRDCTPVSGHKDIVLCVDVSYDGEYIVTSSKDCDVRVWKTSRENNIFKSIHCVAHGVGHTEPVGAVCFAKKDNCFIISAAQDLTVKVWNTCFIEQEHTSMVKLSTKGTVKAHNKDINAVDVSPNNKLFSTCSHDKTIKIWATDNISLLATLAGHRKGVWHCKFSPVDKCLASASSDRTIKLWSLHDYICLKTFESHSSPVLKVEFLTKGMQLASCAADGLLKIWTLKTGECTCTLDGHTDKIWALTKSQSEDILYTGSSDSLICIWGDVTEKIELQEEKEKATAIEQEQLLANFIEEGKFFQAAKLAISLGRPFTLLNLCKSLTAEENVDGPVKTSLEHVVSRLNLDELSKILMYVKVWNTNAKHSFTAQKILKIILKYFSPEQLLQCKDIKEIVEGLFPYTERHFSRINLLIQQSFFVDYTWKNMRMGNTSMDVDSLETSSFKKTEIQNLIS